jgi:GTP-binding protein|tara:strand:+ start:3512 stop:4273 length:762 start_codon:yes stop_codon:yes gene_type:complete
MADENIPEDDTPAPGRDDAAVEQQADPELKVTQGSDLSDGSGQNPSEGLNLSAGKRLFSGSCEFLLSAATPDQVPASILPEIAFAGRSNVGKSSLVNALTGRKTLARTSNTPGRTQLLNFFEVGDRLMIVDLPGYGFAQAPKKDVEAWTRRTRSYLKGRPQLRRVLLLIDSRHGLKTVDREIMAELDKAAVSYQIILTKIDKIKQGALRELMTQTTEELKRHVAAHPIILPTSAAKALGIAELRAHLSSLTLT